MNEPRDAGAKGVPRNQLRRSYRALLLLCACYFLAVAVAHQLGWKVPLLYIFYAVPSERYQDLIISFLAFGWAALFLAGFLDRTMRPAAQTPILIAGLVALAGLIRVRLEVPGHPEIDYEIAGLAALQGALVLLFALQRSGASSAPH